MTAEVGVRPIRPGDLPALRSMFGRCSPETRHRRFHGCVTELPAAYLRRCLGGGPEAHAAFVAEAVIDGAVRLVGLAGAGPVPGAPGVRELGALVEDRWQRQGVGRLLTAAVCEDARAAGVEVLRLELCRSQPSLVAYVVAHAEVVAARHDGCDLTVDVALDSLLTSRASPAAETAR